jgi:DNA helicase HerA-like ATPase
VIALELGTVIATQDGPSPFRFSFVVRSGVRVGLNRFVKVEVDGDWLFGHVTDVVRTNRYFERTDAVWEYERGGGLSAAFPTKMWEYSVASVRVIGSWRNGTVQRPAVPPSPGQTVYGLSEDELWSVLGLDREGLEIGTIEEQGCSVRLNPTRLLQKHLAILAMSGAGKSNCARVLVEELLRRGSGRPAVVIFDVHGEYSGMASAFRDQVKVVRAESVRIAVSEMTIWHFKEFLPEMSGSQARDLSQILAELRSQSRAFGIEEVIERLRESERVNRNLRAALEGWLFDLQALGVFGRDGWPRWEDVVAPGTAVIVDMERITSLTKKQILLAYIADRLFLLRRRGLIPPTVLVIEEAHTFAPTESAISKHILETIAREGRKFFMSLVVISQRPVRLSATLLSQTNTNIILRITNPYDLEHIKKSSEMVTGEMTDAISSLAVGEALVVGEAVNFPVFVRVRKSITSDRFESSFEEAARLYELSTRPGSWSTETSEQSSSLRMDSGESTRSSTYSSITGERST